jgi:hypothetical protein
MGIIFIHEAELGMESDSMSMDFEKDEANGMEGATLDFDTGVFEQRAGPMDHFFRGFTRERNQQNLFRREALEDEFGHPIDEGMGFPCSGAG